MTVDWVQFTDLLAMPAVHRAALALGVGSLALPLVGVVIIGLNIMPVRFAVMHVALLGIAAGLLTGLDPMLCALIACAFTGAGITPFARTPAGLSGAMGLLMSLAIAGALLMLSLSGVNAATAFELLWGSILAVKAVDICILVALAVLVPTVLVVSHKKIVLLLNNRELALASGIRVDLLTGVLLVLVAISIVSGIRLTGALLVDALTLLPALTGRRLGTTFASICLWSIAASLVSNSIGFTIALLWDLPPGPVLVLVAGALVLMAHLRTQSKKGPECESSASLPSVH